MNLIIINYYDDNSTYIKYINNNEKAEKEFLKEVLAEAERHKIVASVNFEKLKETKEHWNTDYKINDQGDEIEPENTRIRLITLAANKFYEIQQIQ